METKKEFKKSGVRMNNIHYKWTCTCGSEGFWLSSRYRVRRGAIKHIKKRCKGNLSDYFPPTTFDKDITIQKRCKDGTIKLMR